MSDSLLITPVEWSYLIADTLKFETLQTEERRSQSADFSQAYIESLLELLLVHY